MITYELAKQLKDAGFNGIQFCGNNSCSCGGKDVIESPSLSELIEKCGDGDFSLSCYYYKLNKIWNTQLLKPSTSGALFFEGKQAGSTPEEAVARLWLELNKK